MTLKMHGENMKLNFHTYLNSIRK